MINIIDKKDCCGCSACVQKCPRQCICLKEDNEGFLYPEVNISTCVECGLCEKVCPVINQDSPTYPRVTFAAINNDDDVRSESSSGGIFTLLAEYVINDGGVVFGAKFDNDWSVVHGWTDKLEGLSAFRSSKYVQSTIGYAYKHAQDFLKQGRSVLFSGTPCQISALKKYLKKEYPNLFTIDVICHGVPSPKIWREYLEMLNLNDVSAISFKDKSTGWRDYSFTIKSFSGKTIFSERAAINKYMMAFVRNLTLRPSCFSCPAKAGKSGADITLGDYWGIEKLLPQINDNKGISFVCCNSKKGETMIRLLYVRLIQADYNKTVPYNSCIESSTLEPVERKIFWENYSKYGIKTLTFLKRHEKNIIKRIIERIIR